MNRALLATAVILTVVLVATPAYAKTIRFPGDYDDPNDAIAAAQPGDKVIISADWAGQVDIVDKDGITILGKKKATISGVSAHPGLNIVDCQDLVVSGLRIENVGYGVTIRGSEDCLLKSLEIDTATEHGIAIGSCTAITVQKCRIAKCGLDGINLDTDLTGTAPRDCIVARNQVAGVDDDGIDVTGRFNAVSKNQIAGVGNSGINMDTGATGENTVEKNQIAACGLFGIHLQSDSATASKNKISEVGDDGIRVDGNDCIVVKNKIELTEDDGIDVETEGSRIEGNRIRNTTGDGIDADGHNSEYIKNQVKAAGDDGMEVDSTDNLVERNVFVSCEDHGLVVQGGSGNLFLKNKAKRNDDDDIWTDVPSGDNIWEKNKFKTGNVPK